MKSSLAISALVWSVILLSPAARAEPPSANGDEFFEKEVRPILAERCHKCHGEIAKPKAKLRLTSRANLLKGGESGPAAIPGKPADSLIIQAIRYNDTPKMPPTEKLKDREIDVLTRWVQMGLPWPEPKQTLSASVATGGPTKEQREFWSFQPVRDYAPPAVMERSWPHSAIDRFILAKLEENGLRPAKPADKRTLIRRATFDLIGLPPTPAEIDAFLADDSPQAFSRVVDRLLSSPHYGERWGRHWLDLVRYTDSFDARIVNGPGNEMDVTEAWRYRDWVVDAFNRDLPYDQFITDQLAGDILAAKEPGHEKAILATGMLAIGNWGGGDADKEKLLTDIVDDQIDVVGRTILALTIGCARCHDHKFEPIPTADYYSLAGIFFSTHILPNVGPKTNGPPMLRIPLAPKEAVEKQARYEARLAELEKELKAAPPATSKSPQTAESRSRLAKLQDELTEVKKSAPPSVPFANGALEGGVPESPHAGIHDVRIHIRGSYARLGDLVPRRFPRILAGENQAPIKEGSGRLQLARWLTSADNPLSARVMANRIWQHHFGQGIVRSASNFGKQGERPIYPELLDYLAKRFVESGWSMKALHRLIMASAAYQQTSEPEPEILNKDPENRLFGRMNRQRLEAEAIRDNLLAAAGRLDRAMGGKAVRDFHSPRRTLYQMTIRSEGSGFGPLFDVADSTAPVANRSVSTVAPQALFLLNHPFVMEQKSALARLILAPVGADNKERIERAYMRLYARPPTGEETRIGLDFLNREGSSPQAWEELCEILLCANEFIYVD
jgi:cytochrome c553